MKADPGRVCGARLAPRPPAVRSGDARIVSPQKEHIRQDVASKMTFRRGMSLLEAPEVGEPPGARSACAHSAALSAALSAPWASARFSS
jgi:hypothetical protein